MKMKLVGWVAVLFSLAVIHKITFKRFGKIKESGLWVCERCRVLKESLT